MLNPLTPRGYRAKLTAGVVQRTKRPSDKMFNQEQVEAIFRLSRMPEWQVLEDMLENMANPFNAWDGKSFNQFRLHECGAYLRLLALIREMVRQGERE